MEQTFLCYLTLYHTTLIYKDPALEAAWKHCLKRRTSIFFFSHYVFTILEADFITSAPFILFSATALNFGGCKLFLCGKEFKEDLQAIGRCHFGFNPLLNDKILDRSKFKAFADDKINMTQKSNFLFGMVENIVGKGENAGNRHFLLFPQGFLKPYLSGLLKVRIML